MKLNKIKIKGLLACILFLATQAYAIDISVSNAGISPDPIVASSTFTIGVDINNQDSPVAITPEDAQFIAISIFGYDTANVVGLVSNTVGWNCIVGVSSIDCDRTFSPLEFSAGSTLPFQVTLSTGVFVNNPDTFTLSATDESGLTEDNIFDNEVMITTSAGATLDYAMSVDPALPIPIQIFEDTTGNLPISFKLENIGGVEGMSEFVTLMVNPAYVLSNVSISNVTNTAWSCNPSTGGWDCMNTMTSNGMLPGEVVTVTGDISSYPTTVGLTANVIEALVTVSGDSVFTNDSAIIGVNVSPAAATDLELEKFVKDGPGAANIITESPVGATFYYQLHINNLSLTAGTNVTVTDLLPAGVQFINDLSLGSWICTADPFIDEFNSQGVSCTHPSIPASSPSFGEIIVFEVVGLNQGMKANTAVVASDEIDSNLIDNDNISSPAMINIINPVLNPDIIISKTILSGTVVGDLGTLEATQGDQVTYKILGINNTSGSVNGDNLSIFDELPPGVTYVSHNTLGPNFNCSPFDIGNNKLTCTATSLPFTTAEDGVEITVEVTGAAGLFVTNTTSITASNDTNTGNNITNSPSFEIVGGALPDVDLTMTKDAQDVNGVSLTSVNLGDTFKYKLFVENFGANNAPVGSVEVQDTLPSEIAFKLPFISPANWTCNITGGNHLTCINDAVIVVAGPAHIIDFQVIAQVTGVGVNNTASVGVVAPPVIIDTDPGNDIGSVSIDIIAAGGGGDLVFNKTVSGGIPISGTSGATNEFVIGDNVLYTLTASNQSAAITYTDLVIKDVLPSNLNFISAIPTQGFICNYNSVGHEVVCNNDVSNPLLPGQVVDIDLNMTAAVAGLGIVNVGNADSAAQSENLNSNSVIIDIVSVVTPTTISVSKQALVAGLPVTSITKGAAFKYEVTITNTGKADAINIKAIDNMPIGVIVNNAQGTSWACNNVAQQYTCEFFGSLAAGASTVIDFTVKDNSGVGVDQLQNNVDVTADNAVLQSASNTIDLTSVALNLNVTQNPNPIVENMPFEFVVDVINTGTEELQGIEVVNTLPVGFSYASQNKASSCSQNGLILTCAVSTPIAIGTTESIVIPVLAIPVVENNITYTNTTTVTGSNFPAVITVNTITNVVAATVNNTDISITKSASENVVSINQSFAYILTVSNNSDILATDVSVTDNLPNGLVLESIDAPANWSCNSGNPIICNLATLAVNESSTIVVNVLAPSQSGSITNTAEVSSNEPDSNPVNNSSKANVNITEVVADLEVSKTASVASLNSGEQFTWNIEVTNNGPDAADHVVISDLLPVGFEQASVSSDNDVNCLNIGREVNCEIAFLQANESRFVTITGVAILDSGVIDNMVTVNSETTDVNIENNTAMASVVVNAVQIQTADLSINVNNESEVNQGEAVEYQISVANNGPNAAESPTVNLAMTGMIDTISVNQGTQWVCQVLDLNVSCEFSGEEMLTGHLSNIILTAQTTRVATESQSLFMTASISSNTNDPELANNSVSSEVGVDGTPTREEILSAMQEALAGTGNRQVNRAIQNVSSYCERKFFEALEGLCGELYEVALAGDGETVRTFMEQITPNEVIGQSTSVAEIATAQFRNVGARLSQLRGGGGSGFNTAGLNARYGNGSIPLGMLAYLNQTDDEKDGLAKPIADFISPWGFFVNGTISMGERDATGRELGFDFDSYGLTAGFDYRLSSKKVIGVALGYANFDSKIGDKAELKSTGVTLTGYGSFYMNDNFYVDARISYSKPDFDQSRDINFTIGNTQVQRTAVGKTSANQYSVAMSAGYNFYKKSWNITPNASFNYVKTTIDSFSETGAGGFNFIYSEQDLESLVWSAGIKVSRAISLKKGVITPQFDFDYNYESKNDGNDIEARFILAPLGEIFIIETDSPDRTYGSAGLGLVYIAPNGKQAYVNYRSVIGLQGFSRGTFNIGARFEF